MCYEDKDLEELRGDIKFKKEYIKMANRQYEDMKAIFLMLKKVAEIEETLGKDLYDFQKDDLDMFFYSLNSTSDNYIKSNWSRIKDYILVANNMHIPKNNIDLSSIYSTKDLNSFVHPRYRQKYLDLDDLLENIKPLKNNQDKAMFILPFYGIKGKEYTDMLDFRKECFHYETGSINFHGKKIYLDSRASEIINDAFEEDSLISYKSASGNDVERKIRNDGYIFRSYRFNRPTHMYFLTRISLFKNTVGIGNISINTCYTSGIACRMIELEKKLKENGNMNKNKDIAIASTLLSTIKKEEQWTCSMESVKVAIRVIKERTLEKEQEKKLEELKNKKI